MIRPGHHLPLPLGQFPILNTDEAAPASVKFVNARTTMVTSHVNMFGSIVDPNIIPIIRWEAVFALVTTMNVDRVRQWGKKGFPLVTIAVQYIRDHEGWPPNFDGTSSASEATVAKDDTEGVAKTVLVEPLKSS